MITLAERKALEQGWDRADFVRCDALHFEPPCPLGAVVFCLSLSTLPEPDACLAAAFRWLAPGGLLIVMDSIPDPRKPIANFVLRLKAPLVGARPTRSPVDFAETSLEEVRVRHYMGGVYTLVSGRKPETPWPPRDPC